MDEQKDIRPSDKLSAFFEKPAMRTSLALNQSADRLYRRAERIVAAIFLATNHISDSESLRVSVRSSGLRLLESVLSLRDEMRAAQSGHASAFKASARYLISLLRMLSISGFLSTQNSTVLIEALDDLGNFLVSAQTSNAPETNSFSRQDFLDGGMSVTRAVKDIRGIKDVSVIRDSTKMSDKATKRTLGVRREGILETLRTGGELGIAEIAVSLPEYSTKMIQRELAEMVLSGEVKKTGLKRWSRYSIVGQ